jgi:hypothetical protein
MEVVVETIIVQHVELILPIPRKILKVIGVIEGVGHVELGSLVKKSMG